MKILFLGTSAGAPTRSRNVSSIALSLTGKGVVWLFDCGEGTQHQIVRSPLRLSQLERIFLTHLHGDHLFGLIGLLASRSLQASSARPVTIYGPPGLETYVRCSLEVSRTRLGYPLDVRIVAPGALYEDEDLYVVCAPLAHGIPAFGYAVIEKELPGRLDAAKARALGVPAGPLYGRLKQGETITLDDGRTIQGASLVGPPRPGRKVVFCGDTTYTPSAVELARGADVLIHEATFLQEDAPLAERAGHATAAMAARVAREAGAGALFLTHFSPRYESEGGSRLGDLLAEAQTIFAPTQLAYDFFSFDVPRQGSVAVVTPSPARCP